MSNVIDCELYMTANGQEFISPKFKVWLFEDNNYMIPLLHLFLQDIVIHTTYRLIKSNKLNKVNLEDVYVNMYDSDTGEIIPVICYMDEHNKYPDKNINDAIYTVDDNLNPEYTSLFDIQKRLGSSILKSDISRDLPHGYKPEKLSTLTKPRIDGNIKFTFDMSDGMHYNYLRYFIQGYILIAVYPDDSNNYYIDALNDWIDSL